MNCRLRKGVLCVMLIRYAGHRLGHRQWPCAVYLGSHCTHSTNTEIQRKTQMTEAIAICCISWITLHRAHPGYYYRLQVLCLKSPLLILQFSDPSTGSSKRDLFLLKQWSFRSMECLAHKKFQIPSTCVVHRHRHSVWQSWASATHCFAGTHKDLVLAKYWGGSWKHPTLCISTSCSTSTNSTSSEGAPVTWNHPTNWHWPVSVFLFVITSKS